MQRMTNLERGISMRIPDYLELRSKISEIVSEKCSDPKIWLDTGCGTGGLIADNIAKHPSTQFVLADPSSENIAEAKIALAGNMKCAYVTKPTDALNFGDSTVDVITAVLCHHYYDAEGRKKATENCFRMLSKGGIYVTVEHVEHSEDKEYKESEWRSFIAGNGMPKEAADAYLARRNVEFFPITENDHIDLLKQCGFLSIERFWLTCADIGFIALK